VFWRDMGVVNLPSGQPTMRLTGGAAERLRALLPPGTEPFIHLTLTDEQNFAQAFVVIEARATLPILARDSDARTELEPKLRRPEGVDIADRDGERCC
jgi:hypothetical protein